MDVSVILVSYNTKDLTRDCLNSVYEKTKDVEFEVFVVDNNSHDGSPEMIEREFPQVRLIKNPDNKGFGAANNIAIRESNAKYIFCLNTDTLLLGNSIKQFFDFMEKEENKNIGACGGNLYSIDGKLSSSFGKTPSLLQIIFRFFNLNKIFKNYYDKHLNCTQIKKIAQTEDVGYISGANLFIRKSILDKTGLFDENIFMYFEDTDLCQRIKKHKYKICVIPNTNIIHLESQSASDNLQKILMSKKSEMYYLKKHKMYLEAVLIYLHAKIKYGKI